MRILVLGATGFIGRHITARLLAAGHDIIAAVRRPDEAARRFPAATAVKADLARDKAEDWQARLEGVDAVVNVAGVLTGWGARAVHVDGPAALYDACAAAGVRRVVLISALGIEADTSFARTKRAGEEALKARDLDWTILRPSLIYAKGSHGGTSLLRGLAGFPLFLPLPGEGNQRFAPLHADDLAETVLRVLGDDRHIGQVLEPAGPEEMTVRDMATRLRAWLDIPAAPILRVPMFIVRLMARLGDVAGPGPIRTTSVRQMLHGVTAPLAPFAAAIGFTPRRMADALSAAPSDVQDRWHARAFFLRPVLRYGLALFWIVSGLIGFFASQAYIEALLWPLGIPDMFMRPMALFFSVVDIAIGLALIARWRPDILGAVQIAGIVGYSVALYTAAPWLLYDPLGPLVKNGPALLAVLAWLALDEKK
jgi:uncharacterized protein YbjT (DUF2867 family)